MKKILLVHVPYLQRGGEDAHVDTLQACYRALGYQVERFPSSAVPPEVYSLSEAASSIMGNSAALESLKRVVARFRPDALHVHNIYPLLGPQFLAWAAKEKPKLVMTVHNHRFFCTNGLAMRNTRVCTLCFKDGVKWRPLLYNCNDSRAKSAYYSAALSVVPDLLDRAVSKFVAPSPYMAALLQKWGIASSKITQITNPVPFDRANLPAGEAAPTDVLYCGRLSHEKGISTLLRAAELAPDVRVTIAGAGPMETHVLAAAARLRNITYLGRVAPEQVPGLVKSCKTTVLPSECNEILPTSVMESYYLGKPCVLSDMESMRWLAAAPFPGASFPAGNAEALAATLKKMVQHPPEFTPDPALFSQQKFSGELAGVFQTL